jgi:hypothetical protein
MESEADIVFDPIIGFDDVKEIFQLSLDADKPVHILLVGPPAFIKQSMIKQKGQRCIYYFYRGHIREITTTQHCHTCFFVWIKCN